MSVRSGVDARARHADTTAMMRPSAHRLCALGLALTLTFAWGERASACSCIGALPEQVTLEIESVTVDGAPTTDLAPWRRHVVTLHPDTNGQMLTLLWHERDADQGTGSERYEPVR